MTSFIHARPSPQRNCVFRGNFVVALCREQDMLSYLFAQCTVFVMILVLCDFVCTNSEIQQSDSIDTVGLRL